MSLSKYFIEWMKKEWRTEKLYDTKGTTTTFLPSLLLVQPFKKVHALCFLSYMQLKRQLYYILY
jgi:hypothetical protein